MVVRGSHIVAGMSILLDLKRIQFSILHGELQTHLSTFQRRKVRPVLPFGLQTQIVVPAIGLGRVARETRDRGLVWIVQHKCGQRFPGRRVIDQVVALTALHDADTPKFADSATGRKILPTKQQVAFPDRVPSDLITKIGGPAGDRLGVVVEVPVDPVCRIAQPRLAAPADWEIGAFELVRRPKRHVRIDGYSTKRPFHTLSFDVKQQTILKDAASAAVRVETPELPDALPRFTVKATVEVTMKDGSKTEHAKEVEIDVRDTNAK